MLDRVRRREVSVRPPDDDRLARSDLPLDLRDDQPEQSRCEASSGCRPPVADRPGRGQAEPAAARPLEPDPRPYEGGPRLRGRASRRRLAFAQVKTPAVSRPPRALACPARCPWSPTSDTRQKGHAMWADPTARLRG